MGRASPFASANAAAPQRAHLSSFGRFAIYERGCPTSFCATPTPTQLVCGPEATNSEHASSASGSQGSRDTRASCSDTPGTVGGCSSEPTKGLRPVENVLGSWPQTPRRQLARSSSAPDGVQLSDEEMGDCEPSAPDPQPQRAQTRNESRNRRRAQHTPTPTKCGSSCSNEAAMSAASPAPSVYGATSSSGAARYGAVPALASSTQERSNCFGPPNALSNRRLTPIAPSPAKAHASRGASTTRASSIRRQAQPLLTPSGPAAAHTPAYAHSRTDGDNDHADCKKVSSVEEQPLVLQEAGQCTGLGAIQPDGRAQVLQQWDCPEKPSDSCRRSSKQQSDRGKSLGKRGLMQTAESAWTSRGTAIEVYTPADADGGSKLEWSSLSRKSRQAIRQWVSREIGGRHCLMLLEHENAIDFLISPLDLDEVAMADLRGGAMLNALSGLRAEAVGGEGGWLYSTVFAKTPAQVLDEALDAARSDCDSGGQNRSNASVGLPLEQMNLALRRLGMNAQSAGMRDLVENSNNRRGDGPRCSEGYMRVQVWLELFRLHSEGISLTGNSTARGSASPLAVAAQSVSTAEPLALTLRPTQARGSGGDDSVRKPSKNSTAKAGAALSSPWDDRSVLGELGKPESELEDESKMMSLDALRSQNRSIEAYLMRLVRQRDELKRITQLADECDSYFILGLQGPAASDDEVKRAYRALARKEHPDKAGVGNKERFQEIQKAYAAVLCQRRNSDNSDNSDNSAYKSACTLAPRNEAATSGGIVGAVAKEAAGRANLAREAADQAAELAHSSYHLCRHGAEIRGLQKRCVVRALCQFTRQGTDQLRGSAAKLRSVREFVCAVSQSAKSALNEYGDWADTAIAGAGLRERAEIASGAGKSSLATAELLVKICEANDAAIRKAEKIAVPSASSSDSLNCERLLGKSLVRTASVARCAADEAIGAATTALELSCSLVALDREWKREKRQEAEQWNCRAQPAPDEPTAESGAHHENGGPLKTKTDETNGDKGADAVDKDEKHKIETGKTDNKENEERLPPEERARREHVSLRVRNLRCLGSLNDETLQLQQRLQSLLHRSQGALLPAVSLAQKGGVFELVGQILNSGLAEATRLVTAAMPARQVLEHSFAFAVALEHAREVALAAEVKTQVLKLAALVDVELVCQIIDGPFKRRLLGVGSSRKQAQHLGNGAVGPVPVAGAPTPLRGSTSVTRSLSRRSPTGERAASSCGAHLSPRRAESWDQEVESFCIRITKGLHERVGN